MKSWAKAIAANRGRPLSAERRAKIATALRGKSPSPEARDKMRAAKLGKPGQPSVWKGKTLSAAHRGSMKQAQTRRFTRPGELEKLAALSRRPADRERQRRLCIALAASPNRTSSLETYMAQRLRAAGIDFVLQFQTTHHAFDFALPEARVLIEVDGCYWHGCAKCGYPGVPKTVALDVRKTAWAKRHGWRLIRVKEHSIRREIARAA